MRETAVLFVGLVVLAACLPMSASAATPSTYVAGTQIEPDDVLLQVGVGADGSATWTVEYRVRLDDDNTTAAFESVREDIAANETAFAAPFADRMEATASAASNATGREMAVRNVTVGATRRQLPQEYGVITYRFEWTGFAAVEGDTIRAGDAISGFFLDEETTLLLTWPDGYEATSVAPDPDERRTKAVVWSGPTDFTTGEPRIVLQAAERGGSDGTPAGGESPTTSPATGGNGGTLGALVVAALVGALLAAAGVWYYWRSEDEATPTPAAEPNEPASAAASSSGASTAASTQSADDTAATEAGEPPETDELESTSEPERESEPESEPEPPEELLSNEERVRRLLKERGGRMKQQEVADALEWSAAKTSQVVTKMREADELESFRLGRENVLSLPEVDEGGEFE